MKHRENPTSGFSLVEVVMALGVVSFAIVAILGMLPVALDTSHAAQDNTRAPQIAQSIFASLAGQATKLDASGQPVLDAKGNRELNNDAKIPNVSAPIDLGTTTAQPFTFYATNDGLVTDTQSAATYIVTLSVDTAPVGFVGGQAAQVTIAVAWPANALPTKRVSRDFIRVISRY